MLRKTVGSWVYGKRSFDSVEDITVLQEDTRDRTHTLLAPQQRIG